MDRDSKYLNVALHVGTIVGKLMRLEDLTEKMRHSRNACSFS
jgi:hypothetical protein